MHVSVDRVKELINDPNLSDKEIEEIRDSLLCWPRLCLAVASGKNKAKKEKEDKEIKMNMKNQLDSNNFTTSDFYAAAFLVAKGYKLLGIDKADSRRFHFILPMSPIALSW